MGREACRCLRIVLNQSAFVLQTCSAFWVWRCLLIIATYLPVSFVED